VLIRIFYFYLIHFQCVIYEFVLFADGRNPCSAVAFPTMPVMFWGKDGAKKYHKAYFDRFDSKWERSFQSICVGGKIVLIHAL